MNVKKFESEKGTVYVYYNKIPGKEELEEACALFMRKAIRELQEKGIEVNFDNTRDKTA